MVVSLAWARLPDLCTVGAPHSLDDHPSRISVHAMEGFSGLPACWRKLQLFAFVCPVWVLMLSHIRNGWAQQVFSASKERFSLRLSHVSVSFGLYRLPVPYLYIYFVSCFCVLVCLSCIDPVEQFSAVLEYTAYAGGDREWIE